MHDIYTSEDGYDETTPILIVGGSLVGLSLALFLSWHGIPVLLVERHATISPHPRAFNFNTRTMEIFRSVGIEEIIRQAEASGYQNSSVLHAESLAGEERNWITQDATGGSEFSLVQGSLIGQDLMEPILRERAANLGGDLRFSTELVSFGQDSQGVSALIRDRTTGIERRVRARYLVAADGSRSAIRQQLGIGVVGPGVQGHQISLLFSADIQSALRDRRIAICFVNNPVIRGGTLILARGEGRGYGLYAHYHPEKGEQKEDFFGERGIALVQAAIGVPDLPVEIMNVTPWEVAAWTAERFQQDRVFLVGDAAHVTPPTGAFGANTGIADAYNLAWKLALVQQEIAHPALLSTYTAERQPVAQGTVEQAYSMFARFASPSAQKRALPSVDYTSVAFGYRYHSTILHTDHEEPTWYEDPLSPTGRPGTHAAHVLLKKPGSLCSTLDLFGRHFVLLTGSESQSECWAEAAVKVASRLDIPVDVYRIGGAGDFNDVDGRFLDAYGLRSDGAVLVRPDGFVGWRSVTGVVQPEEMLEQGLSRLLAHSSVPV